MSDPTNEPGDHRAHERGERRPSSSPIRLATVHACDTTDEADYLLAQPGRGYVYQRDGHPNGDELASICAAAHGGDRAFITASGMGALSAVCLASLEVGDHVLISDQLYGKTFSLVEGELARLGILSDRVDFLDLEAVEGRCRSATKLFVVETISNPRLRVVDLASIAELAKSRGVRLLVDNTFATPCVCQPLQFGADWVMESLTKFMNGHGDVTLGMVTGRGDSMSRLHQVITTWGLGGDPFTSWLAVRGMKTLPLRAEQANASAIDVAGALSGNSRVRGVDFPGLDDHPDHEMARAQFRSSTINVDSNTVLFGNMVTIHVDGGKPAVDRFIGATQIPFFPSLGDTSTSFSHPISASHRAVDDDERKRLGIHAGTIRFSIGIEPSRWIIDEMEKGLRGLDA